MISRKVIPVLLRHDREEPQEIRLREVLPRPGRRPRLRADVSGIVAEDLRDDPPRNGALSLGPVQVGQGHGPDGGGTRNSRPLRRFRPGGGPRGGGERGARPARAPRPPPGRCAPTLPASRSRITWTVSHAAATFPAPP